MFRNLSLGSKLVAAFVVVSILCAVVGVTGILYMKKMKAGQDLLTEKVTYPLGEISEASTHYQRMRNNVSEFVMAKDGAERDKIFTKIAERRKSIVEFLAPFEKSLVTDEAKAIYKETNEALAQYNAVVDKAVALARDGKADEAFTMLEKDGNKFRTAVQDGIQKMMESKEKLAKEVDQSFEKDYRNAYSILLTLVVVAVVAAVAFGVLLSRSISKALTRAVDALSDGAQQVGSAAMELSSSSQTLAEGSSEAAASLEETSSAMEEMSAMTRQNAENASQARQLSEVAGTNVDKANSSMGSLVGSMAEISSMGEEVGKIIKTIDEIAFQTNLLALNAAVEAARAGEAGAGFAVVADEVRNLAQRAAGAAKNTSDLIERTVGKIKDGTQLVEKTNEDFQEVAGSVKKVNELVSEISAASSEQSRGITEVSSAISQMDKVTQQTAANAEEIASSTEELSAQGVAMQEIVSQIHGLVHGAAAGGNHSAGAPRLAIARGNGGPRRAARPAAALTAPSGRVASAKAPASPKAKAAKSAEEAIPFDNDDMETF